ncbi:hypothetical protein Bbelb_291980 [Branchiostoma belcheri]|nr:hypothetical protein Bbelb_291980 [Branchiostoma belcheri]
MQKYKHIKHLLLLVVVEACSVPQSSCVSLCWLLLAGWLKGRNRLSNRLNDRLKYSNRRNNSDRRIGGRLMHDGPDAGLRSKNFLGSSYATKWPRTQRVDEMRGLSLTLQNVSIRRHKVVRDRLYASAVTDSERMDIITMLRSPGVQSKASVQGGHCQARGDCDKTGVFAWHIGLGISQSQVFIRIKHLSIHTRNTGKTQSVLDDNKSDKMANADWKWQNIQLTQGVYHRQGESQSLGCRQGIENVGNIPCDGTGKGLGHLLHTVLQPVPVATWSNAWPTASVPTLTTGIALSSNCKVSSSRKQ